jgi:hypothetical protein
MIFKQKENKENSEQIKERKKWLTNSNTFGNKFQKISCLKATNRIAVIDLNWSLVKASDIFALFSSFLPENSRIFDVTILPSEFGMMMMKEEKIKGPNLAYIKKVAYNHLNHYERLKKRWFYAIAVFDSDLTARHVLSSCIGLEFELSETVLDLRFVPDNVKFDKRSARDIANEILPQNSTPIYDTKIHTEFSWDQLNPERRRIFERNPKRKEIETAGINKYFKSDSEEEIDDVLTIRERYRELMHIRPDISKISKIESNQIKKAAIKTDNFVQPRKIMSEKNYKYTYKSVQPYPPDKRQLMNFSVDLMKNVPKSLVEKKDANDTELEDVRFSALFISHDFALDASNLRSHQPLENKNFLRKAIEDQKSRIKTQQTQNKNLISTKVEKENSLVSEMFHWTEVRHAVTKLREKSISI